LNRPLLAVLIATPLIVAAASGGYLLKTKKSRAKKAQEKTKIVKLAEFEVEEPRTRPEGPKEKSKVEEVVLVSRKEPDNTLKDTCLSMSVTKVQKRLKLTRVVAGKVKSKKEAVILARRIKRRNPSLNPWFMRRGGLYLVVAGSYADPKRIALAVRTLKEMGISPSLEEVVLKRPGPVEYRIVCRVKSRDRARLLEIARRLKLQILTKDQGSSASSGIPSK